MKIYFSEKRIVLFTLCSAFVYNFLYFPFIDWKLYSASTILCIALVTLYVIINIETVFNMKEYRAVNLLACAYFFSVIVSKHYNQELSPIVLAGFIFQCMLLPFIELQRKKGHINFLYKAFLLWYGIGLLFNDILMVIMPARFYGDGYTRNFFLGNKFQIGYNHIILLMIICLLYSSAGSFKKWLFLLVLVTAMICYYIDCNTVILGTAILFLVYLLPESTFNWLCSKRAVLTAIVICAMFVFFAKVTQVPPVKYFITEILERDVTMTGRQQIFAIIPKLIRRKPWLGYGSSAYIVSKYTGAFNTQNGFFELVVCNGIPSAILYVILLVSMIRTRSGRAARIFLGGIYAYIVMSLVEVAYGTELILFAILLFTETSSYQDQKVQILEPGTLISVRL